MLAAGWLSVFAICWGLECRNTAPPAATIAAAAHAASQGLALSSMPGLAVAEAGALPRFSLVGERPQRVELRPELAIFRNGVAMERAAVQPFLECRLILGGDLTRIEARHPSRGLSLDRCRIGKRQDFAFVGHCAFKPSTELLCLFGLNKSR